MAPLGRVLAFARTIAASVAALFAFLASDMDGRPSQGQTFDRQTDAKAVGLTRSP